MIDLEIERDRIRKEIDEKTRFLKSTEGKLLNEQFISRAPDAVVQKEKDKAEEIKAELVRLKASLEELA